jgi:adenylate cyclase
MLDDIGRLPQVVPLGYCFGRFTLRGPERVLLAAGAPVDVGSRAFDVLLMLAETAGDLVTKGAILDRAWSGIAVEENNLQVQISNLRRVLGPDRDWIVTIPGHGYRFTAPVTVEFDVERRPTAPISPNHMASRRKLNRLSILILPVADRTERADLDWHADSMTDSLTTDLARALPACTVVAHTSPSTGRDQNGDIREIARGYGVHYVLQVSMLLTHDFIRVNAQLIDVDSGAYVWAERFDKPWLGILQVQDEIVGRLSHSVWLQLIACEARRAEKEDLDQPDQRSAANFVLRGHAIASQRAMTPCMFEAARTLYERALGYEPDNADALAGIAGVRVYQVLNGYLKAGWTQCDDEARAAHLTEAEDKLTRALAIAPGHFAALKARALLLRAQGAFAGALVAAETLLTHNSSEPMGYREIGLNLLYLGRAEEAVEWFRRADTLMPSDPIRWTWLQGLGRALIHLGRDQEAAEALRLAIDSNPTYTFFHALLAAALVLAGEHERARVEMGHFLRAEPAMTLDVIARRCAIPLDATNSLYRSRNERLLQGLSRAGLE